MYHIKYNLWQKLKYKNNHILHHEIKNPFCFSLNFNFVNTGRRHHWQNLEKNESHIVFLLMRTLKTLKYQVLLSYKWELCDWETNYTWAEWNTFRTEQHLWSKRGWLYLGGPKYLNNRVWVFVLIRSQCCLLVRQKEYRSYPTKIKVVHGSWSPND